MAASLLTVEEALQLVLEHAHPLQAEQVPLDEAPGRVLAEDARSVVDLPPFPSSAMDGFAVRTADTPGRLRVELRAAAGRPVHRAIEAGEAIGIATGAVVPDGADAVVLIENVTESDGVVEIPVHVPAGDNIRPTGGDVNAGSTVVAAGTRLGAAQTAALAAAGVATVVCARRPRVAVIVTGTELRPPGAELHAGEIYESNGPMLEVVLAAAGGTVTRLAPVADDLDAHRQAFSQALDADVVVSSGGVSVGPHDLVRAIGAELGVEEVFWGVAMRPGKPLSFATRGDTLLFGLPGNPVSSLVGATLFVAPALLARQGANDVGPRWQGGVLGESVRRNPHRDDFTRARSSITAEGVTLMPIVGQESHMIVRAAAADALVHVPRGEGTVEPGSAVRYVSLD
jgi:molybdopterin molybdotransferase